MQNYKKHFLRFAEERQALKFGEFTLKSGRISPYFFNAGTFYTGEALARLGRHYADAIVQSGVEFDMLFGPAYKLMCDRLTAKREAALKREAAAAQRRRPAARSRWRPTTPRCAGGLRSAPQRAAPRQWRARGTP